MVHTKKLFIEITTIDKISNDLIFLALKKNIQNSYIKIFSAEQILLKDVGGIE